METYNSEPLSDYSLPKIEAEAKNSAINPVQVEVEVKLMKLHAMQKRLLMPPLYSRWLMNGHYLQHEEQNRTNQWRYLAL